MFWGAKQISDRVRPTIMRATQLKPLAKKTSTESVSAITSKATTSAEVVAALSTSAAEPVQVVKTNVFEVDKTPQDESVQSIWADEPEEVMVTGDPSESLTKTWDEFETRSTGSPGKIRPLKASEEGNSRHCSEGPQGPKVQELMMPDSRVSLVPEGAGTSSNVAAPVASDSTSNGKQQESEKDSLGSVNTPVVKGSDIQGCDLLGTPLSNFPL